MSVKPELEPKPASASELTLSQFMQPEHANSMGNVHGGWIMKLCDEAAGIVAHRHARRPCVTVAVDSMSFLSPVYVGNLMTLHARLTYTGRTSMEVEVRVEAEDILTGQVTHTNSAFFVYVALDDERRPTPIPSLLLEPDAQEQRFREGEARQKRRLEMWRS